MAIELMGNYGREYAKTSEVQSIKQTSKANTKSVLDMNDFIKLMAAQLRHQDMNNPLNESEMMAQMAQMATVQAMTTFTDIAVTSYSASLVGKEVTLAQIEEDGQISQLIGKVTGAGLYNGKQIIFVGGKSYNLSQIMAVGELPDSENAIRVDEKGNVIKKTALPEIKPLEEELPQIETTAEKTLPIETAPIESTPIETEPPKQSASEEAIEPNGAALSEGSEQLEG